VGESVTLQLLVSPTGTMSRAVSRWYFTFDEGSLPIMKKFWDWLTKLLSDSLTGALTKLLTVFLFGVIFTLSGVVLVTFVSILSKTIPVPGYILVVLILFALIGVLIPVSKIINIFHDYKTRVMQGNSVKKIEETLEFEEYPR
jgi:hypothetical protein